MKNILVIAAHPDDEVYGMGGTIARLAKEGCEVNVLIVTDGSTSQYRNDPNLKDILEAKKLETEMAKNVLGVKELYYGKLPDMRLDQTAHININQVIESTINLLNPDTVFTHFWGDVNMDHRCVYQSTLVAVRPTSEQCVKELYCYSVPSSTEWMPLTAATAFLPNTFVDISAYTNQKEQAILAYKTELREYPHPRSVEAVRLKDKSAGINVGLPFAEEFILLRNLK
ncbi:MAG: PIG-L family deacetylase [Oscillospiraceae bacterium]|nr:PIG-L family deacetylase [Oscillospiraceae bacterium]MDD4413165.1 PIG-L family deacetylase [Oscillospiraceae bacterium]